MPCKKTLTLMGAILAAITGFLAGVAPASAASKEKVLQSFCYGYSCTDGSYPYASLIFDAAGSLYGTTNQGGGHGAGAVFKVTREKNGRWTEQVLYGFCPNCSDGVEPYAGLIFDASGNLYGTTAFGGAYGGGTVFELLLQADGRWTEKVLYSFCSANNCTDGYETYAGLIFDAAGNLYGATNQGGATNNGTVFQLTPDANGTWTEKVLYSFQDNGKDGFGPQASLTFDAAGNLYGETTFGGAYAGGCDGHGCGAVFQLAPGTDGEWREKVLHSFGSGTDGQIPVGGLTSDPAGNLYGVTLDGGAHGTGCHGFGCGTVFQLAPDAGGKWKEKVLHSFGNRADGYYPFANVIFDAAGNLYGTTLLGGGSSCGSYGCGTAFQLTPVTKGKWKEKVLHSFTGGDGSGPRASLILDAAGNLYGTTEYGGAYDGGTLFEITP